MVKKFYLLTITTCLVCSINGQGILKKIKSRVEQSVGNAAGNRMDKEINKAMDKPLPGKRDGKVAAENERSGTQQGDATVKSPSDANRLQSYGKFDFVAGNDLLLADDFSQDEIGAFADKWNTNGKGEVVRLKDGEDKWIKMSQQSVYLTPNTKLLPESFTIEFDVIWDMHNKGYMYPEITLSLFNTGTMKPNENAVFKNLANTAFDNTTKINLQPGGHKDSWATVRSYSMHIETFKTQPKDIQLIEGYYGKPMHVAISVHKQRFRLWINEAKIFDLPKLIENKFNQFAFGISSSNYTDEQLGFYFSNFKLAGGLPDVKSKLLTEGKLISTAITFDVNSDKIKSSSYGAIKEIAEALQSAPDVKIKITGHTDSDGDSKSNISLSLKRAAAVKNALSEVYGIDASRIQQVEGKGEDEPVADNNSPVGKAKNRRVEFTRL
jgi:OmpA-OmpF porin, OOP family